MSRFLIGKGELLTHSILPPPMKPGKLHPYSLEENREHLLPELQLANDYFKTLSSTEAPDDVAVAKITLHPAYIAKSYFPRDLLAQAGLESIGSRDVRIKPRRVVSKKMEPISDTTQLFVAGSRRSLRAFDAFIRNLPEDGKEATEFREIESIAPMTEVDRLKPPGRARVFEAGLHLLPGQSSIEATASFAVHARLAGFTVNPKYTFQAGRLLFLAVEGAANDVPKLSRYALLRVLRPMPKLRGVRPISRGVGVELPFRASSMEPLSREPRVAILDGGIGLDSPVAPFVRKYHLSDDLAGDVAEYLDHGVGVTSAFLFGAIQPGQPAPRAFSLVDHYRVLDEHSDQEDPYELYRTLSHVETVLLSRQYEFINLSLGPDLPVEDADVHAWTAVLDSSLDDGATLLTVAVGNNGRADRALGLNRIQVPADCVNALSVGAADSRSPLWRKADYSAVGPGRSPGRRKPDVAAFGGSGNEYFHHVSNNKRPVLQANLGTSFASPLALRSAVGVRAALGPEVKPLTTKAIVIHSCEFGSEHTRAEVGHGRIQTELADLVSSDDHSARIIYQGTLSPGKFLRANLPLPKDALLGKVTIRATFCFATEVDPQDSGAYTKAGLTVRFRPNSKKFEKDAREPKPFPLFPPNEHRDEAGQRRDLGKWETVLQGEHTFYADSLLEPTFDIHYNARAGGAATSRGKNIPYALVVTVSAPKVINIHAGILAAHKLLTVLEPQVAIPIRV